MSPPGAPPSRPGAQREGRGRGQGESDGTFRSLNPGVGRLFLRTTPVISSPRKTPTRPESGPPPARP